MLEAWLRARQLPPVRGCEPLGAQPRSSPLTYSRPLLQQPSPLLWTTLIDAQHVANTLVLTRLPQIPYVSPLDIETPVIQRGFVLSSNSLLELHPHHSTVRVTSGSFGSIRLLSVLLLRDLRQQSTRPTPSAPTHARRFLETRPSWGFQHSALTWFPFCLPANSLLFSYWFCCTPCYLNVGRHQGSALLRCPHFPPDSSPLALPLPLSAAATPAFLLCLGDPSR